VGGDFTAGLGEKKGTTLTPRNRDRSRHQSHRSDGGNVVGGGARKLHSKLLMRGGGRDSENRTLALPRRLIYEGRGWSGTITPVWAKRNPLCSEPGRSKDWVRGKT